MAFFVHEFRFALPQRQQSHSTPDSGFAEQLADHPRHYLFSGLCRLHHGFCPGLMVFMKGLERRNPESSRHFIQLIPEVDILDELIYQSVVLGLCLSHYRDHDRLDLGAYAWGSYWSWDPKETWSLITGWSMRLCCMPAMFGAGGEAHGGHGHPRIHLRTHHLSGGELSARPAQLSINSIVSTVFI